ncbi:MAG: OmpA family protein [Magnetococcales bacterium]|nr:OmpA family protein [Magnetococcales bacterium]
MYRIVLGLWILSSVAFAPPALADDFCAPNPTPPAAVSKHELPPTLRELCATMPLGGPVQGRNCPPDRDLDGVADTLDRCANTPKWVPVDAKGCPLDEDRDRIPDYQDRCPGTPTGVKVDAKGCWILKLTIPFEADKSELLATHHAALDRVACQMRQGRPKMEIQGHQDRALNEAVYPGVDLRRARAVADYLIYRGVKPEALIVLGLGDTKPLKQNKKAANGAANNRVELHPR